MDAADVERIAVLGAGRTGHSVAEVAALAGFEVRLRDITNTYLDRGYELIRADLDRLAERGQVTGAEVDATLDRISTHVELEPAVDDVDVVVETVPERVGVKRELYSELADHLPERSVVTTDAAALPVTSLADRSDRPERFCGLQFFPPPARREVVEVVAAESTVPQTLELVEGVAERLGKTPIRVPGDPPGHVVYRTLVPAINEAAWLVSEDAATIETVEASARFGIGFPAGTLALGDRIGLDVCANVLDRLVDEFGDAYEPAPALTDRVEADDLGHAAGAGFHDYGGGAGDGADADDAAAEDAVTSRLDPADSDDGIARLLLAVMAREAAALDDAGVADAATVDRAVELAVGIPGGPATLADDVGLPALVTALDERREAVDHPRYGRVDPLRMRAGAGEPLRAAGSDDTPGDAVRVETVRDGRVARIVLDRPSRLNTVDAGTLTEFDAALARVTGDGEPFEDVRALVVTGAGSRAFSAGLDVDVELLDDADDATALARRGQRVFGRLETCGLPVVAAIDGYCLGGGMEIAACADLRVASDRSTFGLPQRNLGLMPGWGATQRLPRIVGETRAKELLLTGDRYDAATLRDYGFLNDVVSGDELDERVLDLAADLADGPPVALRRTKRAVHAGRDDIDAGLELEAEAFGRVRRTDDAVEGLRAYRNDEDPTFEGR